MNMRRTPAAKHHDSGFPINARKSAPLLDTQRLFFVALQFAVCLGQRVFLTKFEDIGHICQLVDSLPYKEEVVGSSPSMPTR